MKAEVVFESKLCNQKEILQTCFVGAIYLKGIHDLFLRLAKAAMVCHRIETPL